MQSAPGNTKRLWIYESRLFELWIKMWIWKKKIQACTGFEHMNSAIKVQRSTNWANKPPGS